MSSYFNCELFEEKGTNTRLLLVQKMWKEKNDIKNRLKMFLPEWLSAVALEIPKNSVVLIENLTQASL